MLQGPTKKSIRASGLGSEINKAAPNDLKLPSATDHAQSHVAGPAAARAGCREAGCWSEGALQSDFAYAQLVNIGKNKHVPNWILCWAADLNWQPVQ